MAFFLGDRISGRPCEIRRKLAAPLVLAIALAGMVALPAAAAAEGEHSAESPWTLPAKIFNFAVLAGTVVYFLRKPFTGHLTNRQAQVRKDLDQARELQASAEAQIAEVEAKLRALPGEIEALRTRGRAEIAAEEARIDHEAEAERQRLTDQARREIELQVRLARRDLVEHAADLAVGVARERLGREITDDDRRRLLDRYLDQVKQHG